jgi:hypothetical protein
LCFVFHGRIAFPAGLSVVMGPARFNILLQRNE